MHYKVVVSWCQMFWSHETNTAEFVLHDYSQDSIIITVEPRLSGPQLTGHSLYPARCFIPHAHCQSAYIILINAHCPRISRRCHMLFRVKAILNRLNKGETSVKIAPKLLYF